MTEPEITRTRFAEGQLLTAEDLRREQDRSDRRFRSLARLLGPGIMEGFDVSLDAPEPKYLMVKPGYAVDVLGRELVLAKECYFTVGLGTLCASWTEPLPVTAADMAPAQTSNTPQLAVIGEAEQIKLAIFEDGYGHEWVPLARVARDSDQQWTVVSLKKEPIR